MPRVKFTADPRLPPNKGGRTWTHTPAGRRHDTDAKGNKMGSWRLVPPVAIQSGQTFEADEAQAKWLLAHYPQCFEVVPETAKRAKAGAAVGEGKGDEA